MSLLYFAGKAQGKNAVQRAVQLGMPKRQRYSHKSGGMTFQLPSALKVL